MANDVSLLDRMKLVAKAYPSVLKGSINNLNEGFSDLQSKLHSYRDEYSPEFNEAMDIGLGVASVSPINKEIDELNRFSSSAASRNAWFDRKNNYKLNVDPKDNYPKTLYKGMKEDYSELKPGVDGAAGGGIYFAENPKKAKAFAGEKGIVKEYFIDVKNPLFITADQRLDAPGLNKFARENGYDSLYIPSEGEWVVFDNKNIIPKDSIIKKEK